MTYLSEPNEIQTKRLASLFLGQGVRFMLGVVNHAGFPNEDVPEICFAGRSNVGKSSLINALTNRKGLARASNTPGRTQELNYFALCDDLKMVDLPGYGFAQAPKEKVDVWNALIRDYLKGRRQLQRIFVLIDSRHGLKKIDEEIFSMLDKAGVSYQMVMTKIDKISKAELEKTLATTKEKAKKFIALHPDIITTSSEKKIGLNQVRHEIASFMPDYVQLGEEDDR